MGTDPCQLCATPGVIYTDAGFAECSGCGRVLIRVLASYLMAAQIPGVLTDIQFSDATFTYQRSPFATRMGFGEWIIMNCLNLIGKP